jgi:AcrR family transcriptional regulator
MEATVANPKEDRRAQRTRQLLHNALMALMVEKRYDHITVQDIIDRANVGRSTFYAHFQDKEDLANSNLEHIFGQLSQHLDQMESGEQQIVPTLGLFRHVQAQHQLIYTLVKGRGMDLFVEKVQGYWNKKFEAQLEALLPQGQKTATPLPIVANYMAGALMTLIKWWMDNQMPYSPERMDEIFHQLVMPGVWTVLEN